ncbi:hypothetical protein PYW07_000457 [Mythimna separata]|uniref:MADF domain-containing protein n=1 Tax=Mythimna separata TaxID=271217 RepID=A0AAD8E0K0_MYTSE|nr:hypothetical protein PYW07_000457 [Mythimna separata]
MLRDSKDPDHLNKSKREDCWRKISKEMKLPIPELKKKLYSLTGADKIYISKWFGFKYFDFMSHKDDTGITKEGGIEPSFSTTRTITTTYAIATTARAIPTRTHAIPTRTHAIATRTHAIATRTIVIATANIAIATTRLTGSGCDEVYRSSWFAYNAFAYMSERNEPGTTRDTMENQPGPSDPRNAEFGRLVAFELDRVPEEKRSVTYVNLLNLIRKVRQQKDLDDISLPSYEESD